MMTRGHFLFLPFLLLFFGFSVSRAAEDRGLRQHLHLVGSSAIYPFAVAVADHHFYGKSGRATVVESTGTGGGIRLFCRGQGGRTPDGVLTSRPFSPDEITYCHKNGVGGLIQLTLGYDGLVLGAKKSTHAHQTLSNLSLKTLRTAMTGSAKTWHDLNHSLPSWPIKILGPSNNSGTKDAFIHLVMTDPDTGKSVPIQNDGRYTQASDQETVVVHKLMLEPQAIALFSYGFLNVNRDRIRAIAIDGVMPTPKTIQTKTYPLTRPFYLVIKADHLSFIPGLYDFVLEFLSEDALGPNGYLKRYGLVSLSPDDRRDQRRRLTVPSINTRSPTLIP